MAVAKVFVVPEQTPDDAAAMTRDTTWAGLLRQMPPLTPVRLGIAQLRHGGFEPGGGVPGCGGESLEHDQPAAASPWLWCAQVRPEFVVGQAVQ
jgi:hypothetical protein